MLLLRHSVMSISLRPHGLQQCHTSLSFTISRSLLKLMSIESVIPSNHLILCHPFSSCLQHFPASGSFPMSWLLASGGLFSYIHLIFLSPDKNMGVGCHAFLQGIFPTQGLNSGLLHCRQILYHLSHQGTQACLAPNTMPFRPVISYMHR